MKAIIFLLLCSVVQAAPSKHPVKAPETGAVKTEENRPFYLDQEFRLTNQNYDYLSRALLKDIPLGKYSGVTRQGNFCKVEVGLNSLVNSTPNHIVTIIIGTDIFKSQYYTFNMIRGEMNAVVKEIDSHMCSVPNHCAQPNNITDVTIRAIYYSADWNATSLSIRTTSQSEHPEIGAIVTINEDSETACKILSRL